MKSYKFIYLAVHSSITVAASFGNEMGEYEIVIPDGDNETIILFTDHKEVFGGTMHHMGLKIIVSINAKDINEGAKKAQVMANGFIGILSLIVNATISEPILHLGYETTETATNTEFVQILYADGELFKQKRQIDPSLFESFLPLIMSNNNSRIARAIRWYRKGLNEVDSLDRFIHYWLGLECLNKLLEKTLGGTPEIRNCKKCGNPYEVSTSIGIKSLFIKYRKNGDSDFKKCRDLRVDLLHGHGDLASFAEVIDEYTEICRRILLQGLFLLLKVDQTIIDMHPEPIYNLRMPYIEYRGFFEISPKDLPEVPYLIIDINSTEVKILEGKRVISVPNKIDTNIPESVKMKMNLVSEEGISMKIQDIKLTPKD